MTSNRPVVTLKAGASEYVVRYDFNTLCALEDEFEIGVYEVAHRFATPNAIRLNDVRRFLLVTLTENGSRLDEGRALEAMKNAGTEACCNAVGEALGLAIFGTTAGPAEPPAPPHTVE